MDDFHPLRGLDISGVIVRRDIVTVRCLQLHRQFRHLVDGVSDELIIPGWQPIVCITLMHLSLTAAERNRSVSTIALHLQTCTDIKHAKNFN